MSIGGDGEGKRGQKDLKVELDGVAYSTVQMPDLREEEESLVKSHDLYLPAHFLRRGSWLLKSETRVPMIMSQAWVRNDERLDGGDFIH